MTTIPVKCRDGTVDVSCINPVFLNVKGPALDMSTAELSEIDGLFKAQKIFKTDEFMNVLHSIELDRLPVLQENAKKIGLAGLVKQLKTTIEQKFQRIQTPGDARTLLGISVNFLENDTLLSVFETLVSLGDFHQN